MVKIEYSCPRCNYKTKLKANMRKHLYDRQEECPGITNDIELTDEIKEKVLKNRIYVIPKKPRIEAQRIQSEEYRHYLYFLREKENVNHCQNVYKFGQNRTKEYLTNVTRLISYGIGTEIILVLKCTDSLALERLVSAEFKIKYEKYKFGNESFIGNESDMIKTILRIYGEYNESIKNADILADI